MRRHPTAGLTAALFGGALLAGGCSTPAPVASGAPAKTARGGGAVANLFITAQIHNTTEPCGCTSTPLGDVSRIATIVYGHGQGAGAGSLLLDAGGLRYRPEAIPPEQQREARLKADFLEATWRTLGVVTGLEPSDVAGPGGLGELAGGRRLVTNLAAPLPPGPGPELFAEELRPAGRLQVGIIGIADPDATWPAGVRIGEALPAAQAAAARLRGRGAQLVVALTGLRREAARRFARKAQGIDVVVAGGDPELRDGIDQAEPVGAALLVVPAQEGQRLVHIALHLGSDGKPSLTLVRTPEQERQAAAAGRERLAIAESRLATLRRNPQAEPAFVRTTEQEVERLKAELADPPPAPKSTEGYVTVEAVPVGRGIQRDPRIAERMGQLDRQIGEANLKAVTGPPPAAPPGQAGYVGLVGCQGSCHFHDDAFDFWKGTHHAQAFPTLVQVGKELSYDCVRCHATGFDERGGSNLWSLSAWQRGAGAGTPDLRGVQCEICHGPGSLHVAGPSKNPVPFPRPTQDRCLTCHTPEHSDTFQFIPYLRDILGPGHGAERRAALGAGPTGHELRTAAQKKQKP